MHKFVVVFFISISNVPLYATPTIRSNFEESFDRILPTISELILEKNNIDIENRGLYLGYIFEEKNDCEYSIKLMDKSKKEFIFLWQILNI